MATAAARPLVTVQSATGGASAGSVALPSVFTAPIRHDIVKYVHGQIRKNKRQSYAVTRRAGHQHSAESWGTGRAVSRIPRVSGGGTHRSGQGAFGNMCRGGRMFAPTKTFRKWTVAVPKKMRRYAVVSALAATALPALVMARGHKVDEVPEFPLVVSDGIESIQKTKDAVALLTKLGAGADVEKATTSTKVRPGKGKWRNRRYVNRKGPLIVYKEKNGVERAFRNLAGVDTAPISALNLTQLAPGGHIGRFIIWSESAIKELDKIYGTDADKPCPKKRNFSLPRSLLSTSDVTRVINSTEVQSVLRPKRQTIKRSTISRNPLKNKRVMAKLNPHSVHVKNAATHRSKTKKAKSRLTRRTAALKARRALSAK